MKILMTADTVGGVWMYALELAHALASHGVEVVLATMGAPLSAHQRVAVAALDNVRVHESTYRLEWMENAWADVDRAGDWLMDLESRECPDLVHLNGYAHGTLAWDAPVLMVGHSCVRSWWDAVKGAAAPAEWTEYTRRTRAGLQAAHAVVAPSGAMRDALHHHYGPFEDVRVVFNARSGPFRAGVKEPFVLSAGRLWDEGKNVAALARVAGALTWPVYVAGSTTAPDGSTARLGELRPLGQLSRDQLAAWFARAAVYALPARYEPFGLSVLEAALSGCALVLGDIPSLRELWSGAAVFVAPDDDEALLAALREVQEKPALRQSLAARAYLRALTFTPQRMAEGYLVAYECARRSHARVTSLPARRTREAPREVIACAS